MCSITGPGAGCAAALAVPTVRLLASSAPAITMGTIRLVI
jgi:hypothetical protein